MSFERIKYYYDAGLWSNLMVRVAVKTGIFSPEQFKAITSTDYQT
ncbi:Phage uncharacterised protein (Phage_XkdX) [uncultured Eubacterium sp.]|nr:Phage uncharacterised protein (Phage_XkdX) [uncultured Eubacterium sp.]